ncbi:MAG: discoidin domain-containing protein [Acidimicrobiia bacterium]
MRASVRVWLVVLTFVGVLASCGGSSDGPSVRDFDDVRASDIVFEADPNDPSKGVLRVTTSEPMICAIVWGEADSFGRFNNSLSMNGTGIVQHDVSLPDVKPGVNYRYIIQGTTASGQLYRSKVASFRVDAPSNPTTTAAVSMGNNIAPKAKITAVSSEFSSAIGASNAIDNDTQTEWATRGDGDNGSITIDLGEPTSTAGVEFVTRSMADGTAITTTYTVSIDDGPPQGPFEAATLAEPRPQALAATGRTIRFDVSSSTGGNVGAVEIRVFA